jgi:uncharacterized RmlC-like cupin family protein
MNKLLIIATMLVGVFTINANAEANNHRHGSHMSEHVTENNNQKYKCPMHEHIEGNKHDNCPICNMKLVPVEDENYNYETHESFGRISK